MQQMAFSDAFLLQALKGIEYCFVKFCILVEYKMYGLVTWKSMQCYICVGKGRSTVFPIKLVLFDTELFLLLLSEVFFRVNNLTYHIQPN